MRKILSLLLFIAIAISTTAQNKPSVTLNGAFKDGSLVFTFKNTTGKTVKSYITDYRMQQAVRLLRNPTVPVGDIAVRCGYRNGNYFSFRFKEHFGISPTEYREQSGEPEKKDQ